MNGYIFDILLIGGLMYEFFKREKEHKMVIEKLKKGIYPDQTLLQKNMIGIILIGIVNIIFIGFLIFLSFFFPIKIHLALLFIPYGIGIILLFIICRDIHIYKANQKLLKGKER